MNRLLLNSALLKLRPFYNLSKNHYTTSHFKQSIKYKLKDRLGITFHPRRCIFCVHHPDKIHPHQDKTKNRPPLQHSHAVHRHCFLSHQSEFAQWNITIHHQHGGQRWGRWAGGVIWVWWCCCRPDAPCPQRPLGWWWRAHAGVSSSSFPWRGSNPGRPAGRGWPRPGAPLWPGYLSCTLK